MSTRTRYRSGAALHGARAMRRASDSPNRLTPAGCLRVPVGLAPQVARHASDTETAPLTAARALALRELSPLFTALAIAILVILWTRLRWTPRVIALFVFLATIPAVVSDNLWCHPDALLLFWVVVVIVALSLDRLRLKR
jgi:hypothetical protein